MVPLRAMLGEAIAMPPAPHGDALAQRFGMALLDVLALALEMQEMADRISKSPKAAKAFLIKRVRTRLKEYGLPMPGRRKRSGTRKPSAQRAKR